MHSNRPTSSGLHILVTLCIDVRNNVAYVWQNLSVFTQKRYFKVILGPNDKKNLKKCKIRASVFNHVKSSFCYRVFAEDYFAPLGKDHLMASVSTLH